MGKRTAKPMSFLKTSTHPNARFIALSCSVSASMKHKLELDGCSDSSHLVGTTSFKGALPFPRKMCVEIQPSFVRKWSFIQDAGAANVMCMALSRSPGHLP